MGVDEIKKLFSKYDEDDSGCISPAELGLLIRDFFPYMTQNVRQLLIDITREFGAKGGGAASLDFPDFIRIMRQFHNIRSEEKRKKVEQAIEDTGFTPDEVKDFTDAFDQCVALNKFKGVSREELSLSDVRTLLSKITDVRENLMPQLQAHFKEALKKYSLSAEQHERIEFSEFLWLMSQLLKTNFASIRDKIGWQAADAEQSTKKAKDFMSQE